jgi:hypothetical protein
MMFARVRGHRWWCRLLTATGWTVRLGYNQANVVPGRVQRL